MSSSSHYGNTHNLLLLKTSRNKCPFCGFILEMLMCHKAVCKDSYLSIFICIHFTEKTPYPGFALLSRAWAHLNGYTLYTFSRCWNISLPRLHQEKDAIIDRTPSGQQEFIHKVSLGCIIEYFRLGACPVSDLKSEITYM